MSGFLNSSYYDEESINSSYLLNSLENKFNTNDYSTFSSDLKKLNIIKNHTINEEITVNKYSYENEDIKIFKYEK